MGSLIVKGIVQGKTIQLERDSGLPDQLERDSGLPDGQEVTVTVEPAESTGRFASGEGLKRAFGAWADDGDDLGRLDRYLEWNREHRRRSRRELEP